MRLLRWADFSCGLVPFRSGSMLRSSMTRFDKLNLGIRRTIPSVTRSRQITRTVAWLGKNICEVEGWNRYRAQNRPATPGEVARRTLALKLSEPLRVRSGSIRLALWLKRFDRQMGKLIFHF